MTLRVSNDVRRLNPQLDDILEEGKKPRKYRNQPIIVDGIRFDSGKEAARAQELMTLYRAGEIIALVFHKRMPVHPEGSEPIYIAPDFIFVDRELNIHVEDTKAFDKKTGKFQLTRDFRTKQKLFEHKYKVKIELI